MPGSGFVRHSYTGAADERGAGDGLGATLNIPLPAGCGDEEYEAAWQQLELPLREFAPQLILVSAGFDAHLRDPLARMRMSADGFAQLMHITKNWAASLCDNRVIVLLEGGYDLQGLADSVVAVVEALLHD
jgi:acetoin utilization deacetylase AcuC-like enzyme